MPYGLINITHLCNNACRMCNFDIPQSRFNLSTDEVRAQILSTTATNAEEITFTGGEPAIRSDILELFEWIEQTYPQARIGLATNARVFHYKEYLDLFEKFKQKLRISTELHADNPELHDKITSVPGSFEQAYSGIKKMHEQGYWIKLNIVVHKMNYKHLSSLARFIVKEFPNTNKIIIYPIDMLGNALKYSKEVLIKNSSLVSSMESALNILLDGGINASIIHTPLCLISKKYHKNVIAGTTDSARVAFDDKCLACILKPGCPGMWKSCYDQYGGDELIVERDIKYGTTV